MIEKREDIEEVYRWDLEAIYKTLDDFNKDFDYVLDNIKNYKKLKDTCLNSGKDLYNYLKFDYKMDEVLGKLYTYAARRKDEDLSNNKNMALYEKIRDLFALRDSENSYFTPMLLEREYSDIEKFYEEEEKLKEYEIIFKRIFDFKDHVLSDKEEKIIASFNKILYSSNDIYKIISDSDMIYDDILDEDNNKVEMSDNLYRKYIESSNRRVRCDAYNSLYKSLKQYKNTFAKALSSNVEAIVIENKLRNFNNSLEASLSYHEINTDIYHNLIDTINKNQEPIYEYFRLKKEMLELDELYFYDVYTPVINEDNKKYTFLEAKDIVINALKILGDDYIKDLNKAFEERWIDVYHTKGKNSGAYSSGSYGTYPYLLLNFQGRSNDITTLAHELGHSMHTYYSHLNQPIQTCDYTIFCAEVASTVNELLLAKYLLKNSTDRDEKLTILNRLLELFKSTIYRQTMFAEFELFLYESVEKGNNLTSDNMTLKYKELLEKYFSDTVVIDDNIIYEWTRIPHFYYNFYVYQYATGLSAACQIVKNIEESENGVKKYKEFLKTGSSMTPIEELKIAGVDMSTSEPIESAISFFNDTLKEFKKVYYKEVK